MCGVSGIRTELTTIWSGMPIHVHGVLLHTMSGSELSHVRTELEQ